MKAPRFTSRAQPVGAECANEALAPLGRAHAMGQAFAALVWVLIALTFFIGAGARLLTIDRGTPGIGVLMHVVMMGAVFVLVALPVGFATGLGAALGERRWGAGLRWAPLVAVLGASAAVWVFMHLGRRPPAWHVVWPTMLWAALLACKVLPWGRRAVEALRAPRQ